MASAKAPWKSIQLSISNDSSSSLRLSPNHPPVLQGCIYSGPFADSSLDGGCTTQLECKDAAREGSAFLTYFIGDFKKKIILLLSIKPVSSVAEIRVGIFDEDTTLGLDMLEKVAKDEIKPATVGLGRELHWKVEDDEGTHEISVIVDIASADRQFEARLHLRDPETLTNARTPIKVNYKIDATGFNVPYLDPVHENMAIASLIEAGVDGFDQETTYIGILGRGSKVIAPASWEFIRGVIWNDDPACYFFHNYKDSNGSFNAFGGLWGWKFKVPGNVKTNITYRSHFGDLQFLHAMASAKDEDPQETRRKIMLWIEVMYKLAVGDGITETDTIASTGLSEFFDDDTEPKGSDSLRDLLMGTTHLYHAADIKRRALGSCLHLIQDSYAVGHCRRLVINRKDMIKVEFKSPFPDASPYDSFPMKRRIYIKGFPDDKPGRFGEIMTLHCYSGQDDTRHGYYDKIPNRKVLKPSDKSSFSCMMGGIDSIDQCTNLVQAWGKGLLWEGDSPARKLVEDVFDVSTSATPSDNKVDEHLWGP